MVRKQMCMTDGGVIFTIYKYFEWIILDTPLDNAKSEN